jgi:cytosolic iron-sulfur protein assembly protein CIAO1
VRIWKRIEQYKWECVQVLEGNHDRTIFSVSWGEGTPGTLGWIASASGDGQIVVYQVKVSSQDSLQTMSNLNKGQGIEGGGTEGRVLTKIASAHGVYDVNCVGWCPRKGLENYLASCGDDGSVRVWKVSVGE